MKLLNFLIIILATVLLTSCGDAPETSQIDNDNPVMQSQQEVAVRTSNTTTEVDNLQTANQPTAAVAEDMADNNASPTPATNKSTSTPASSATTTTERKVIPKAKLEKPRPLSTEVEQKVKVMANETETQTSENVSTTSTSPVATAVPPRPTTENQATNTDKTTAKDSENMTTEPTVATPDHGVWNSLLQKNVSSSGKVNYAGIKAQKSQLEKYLTSLENNPPQADWSRNEKLAYWINAYNAYTVKLIVDNYPVKSITDLEGGKPWDKKWINIGGKSYSLNNIEHDIIRPRFKEPRIHFAVNCAAQSCPPILNKAWTADNLNRNFNQQAKAFINNSKYNQISANSVTVSKIFDWYGEDFDNLISYLNKYSDTKINSDATVNYKEYDWALNN